MSPRHLITAPPFRLEICFTHCVLKVMKYYDKEVWQKTEASFLLGNLDKTFRCKDASMSTERLPQIMSSNLRLEHVAALYNARHSTSVLSLQALLRKGCSIKCASSMSSQQPQKFGRCHKLGRERLEPDVPEGPLLYNADPFIFTAVKEHCLLKPLRALQAQMDDFLRTGNTKAGIYRDVICEQDYDPLSTRSRTLKVQTGPTNNIKDVHGREASCLVAMQYAACIWCAAPIAGDLFDPLKRDWIKARNERLNMGLSAGTSGQLARDTFDTKVGPILFECKVQCGTQVLLKTVLVLRA
eukprot:scaffold54594_cov20-Tisochrysis_lutea.AAC.1